MSINKDFEPSQEALEKATRLNVQEFQFMNNKDNRLKHFASVLANSNIANCKFNIFWIKGQIEILKEGQKNTFGVDPIGSIGGKGISLPRDAILDSLIGMVNDYEK